MGFFCGVTVLFDLIQLLIPFVVAVAGIHVLEQLTQRRLARRFGWHSVIVTGWIGTPIHELSHAVACYLFGHKITDMALFKPDMQSGRLGYVRHSYQRGHTFQELGNLFIGLAPLAGGTLALLTVTWVCYPELLSGLFAENATSGDATGSHWTATLPRLLGQLTTFLFDPSRWLSIRFWIFLYLVLCVSGHMAPSQSDYQGASKAALWCAGLLVLAFGVIAITGSGPVVASSLSPFVQPIAAIFVLSLFLCAVASIVVFVFTAIWDAIFRA